jgi:regulator of protease activity HflC (stomatin/prohibitin superfamily)
MNLSFIVLDSLALIIIGAFIFCYMGFTMVKQGHVAVITNFGKYSRIIRPGLSLIVPFREHIFRKISVQNQSADLEFSAISSDQANVDFKTMLLYSVIDDSEETIKRVAFKFINNDSFMQALIRSIEGSVRAYVATKKQNEILGLRQDIVDEVKKYLAGSLLDWGYQLIDIQINDILFDEAIMRSMAQVVASENLKAAAQNEAEAYYITQTKKAEAEKESARLKGEGMAIMEDILASGIVEAAQKLRAVNLDYSMLLFTNWTESMKHVAEHGSGNVIFFDGSTEGLEKTMKQMKALEMVNSH